ncbi:E3 SUMO-protein ligase KIAA1586-like [Ruditapes philippinarum]|uniref:E3 SUMO-protein ligase KIAA1586-like n=1 Tax=Ruditapes philippinarum TaxID=129788 RepID=UPI00295C0076|nr:E3 SUMO-protein ligase KIAA1586-like [Ruditapes philippinarum]
MKLPTFTVVSEMIIYIRYLKDGVSKTDFISILPLPGGKADTITETLGTFLTEDLGLQLEKMCALGSDGAKVMVGRQNGVAAQLRRRVPHLVNNHCVAHRLALAVGQAAKGVPYLQKFKDIIGTSPGPKLKLVEAKDVRWLSHDKATTTLRKCLPSIYTSLEREAEERNDARAAGLSVFTQDYRFVLAIHMICDVLPHLTALSCAMQKRDAVYVTIKPLVNGTISIIQGMKSQSADNYKEAPARGTQLIDDGFRIKSPSEEQLTAFHEKIYLPFLDNLLQNLEDRFPDLPLLEKFGAFSVGSSEDDNHQDIQELARHFGVDMEQCRSNWHQVRASLEGLISQPTRP